MAQDVVRDEALAQLRAGQEALAQGRLVRATQALGDAETRFNELGDPERAGDARVALAETQRQNGAVDQAANSYERAITLYKQAENAQREAAATLALGHV